MFSKWRTWSSLLSQRMPNITLVPHSSNMSSRRRARYCLPAFIYLWMSLTPPLSATPGIIFPGVSDTGDIFTWRVTLTPLILFILQVSSWIFEKKSNKEVFREKLIHEKKWSQKSRHSVPLKELQIILNWETTRGIVRGKKYIKVPTPLLGALYSVWCSISTTKSMIYTGWKRQNAFLTQNTWL